VLLILHRLTGVEYLDRIWRLTGGTLVAAAGLRLCCVSSVASVFPFPWPR
jgi:hypothetical protein